MWELRLRVLTAFLCGATILVFSKSDNPLLLPAQPIICMGNDSVVQFKNTTDNRRVNNYSSSISDGLSFEIVYTDVPEEAKPAIKYAFDQWSAYLKSTIPIRIEIKWMDLGHGILGSSFPSSVLSGSDFDHGLPNVIYPVALAEKLARKEFSGNDNNDAVIKLNNKEGMWYMGTDGNVPTDKYDLVTIVMHEFVHCIGFFGTLKINEFNQGKWGFYNPPQYTVYDKFIVNSNGDHLVNTEEINNPSVALFQYMTGNNLYFRSPVAYMRNSMFEWPRLYAPSTYSTSSIYHLNDYTYPYNDINALMTHETGKAEVNHNPGPLVLGMLEEMGWSHTYIEHTKHKDVEDISLPLEFKATIESDNPLLEPINYFFYRLNENGIYDSVLMDEADNNEFACTLEVNQELARFDYYIKAKDNLGRAFYYPDTLETEYLSFQIGPDTIKPIVTHHSPIEYITIEDLSKELYVNVYDNLEVDSVFVKYFVNGVEPGMEVGLFDNRDDLYIGELKFAQGQLKVDDIVEYSIFVVDKSIARNTFEYKNDELLFEVEDNPPIKDEYSQNFNDYTNDFIGVRKIVRESELFFEVSTPEGLLNGCLHTPNPYVSLETDTAEYIAQLRFPIRLDKTGGILYDEIVLVEPGRPGAVFGDSTFFDYVIVEASNDSGSTWRPVLPGYDSRSYSKWINAYNSNFDVAKNNSLTLPTNSTYITRNVSIVKGGGFEPYEEVFLRFRLLSDEYSHGWGWAIDNLRIQGEVGLDDLPFNNVAYSVYPNPFNERLNIDIQFKKRVNRLKVVVKDILGKILYCDEMTNINSYSYELDTGQFASGIYLVVLDSYKDSRTIKIIKP